MSKKSCKVLIRVYAGKFLRLSSLDLIETILEYLDISYTFNQRDIENIPSIGKVIIVSNHLLGTADALALINRLANAR